MTTKPCKNAPDCANEAEADRAECSSCRWARRSGSSKASQAKPMRTLLVDIETSPNLAYVWGLWDQNVGLNQLRDVTEMICFAAKWLGEPKSKTMFFSNQQPGGREAMVLQAHVLLDEADALMHFNGRSFDVKHLNREFILAGLMPPSPYKQIDLLLASRSRFKFPSNKLQYISKALGLAGKAKHEGFELWTKCMAGDAAAWKRMERYNRQDVLLLEELYYILLPWLPQLPNLQLYADTAGCPACGSEDLQKRGLAYTKLSTYQQYRCSGCGSYFRGSKRLAGASLQPVAS